jgi:hypothetical protein
VKHGRLGLDAWLRLLEYLDDEGLVYTTAEDPEADIA